MIETVEKLKSIASLKPIPKVSMFDLTYGQIFTGNPIELLEAQRLHSLYGNIFSIPSISSSNSYFIAGPEEVAHIHKNNKRYIKQYNIDKVFQKVIGAGILNSSGSKFDDRRKNLLPAFSMENIKQYITSMQRSLDRTVGLIKEEILIQQQANKKAVIDIDKYSTITCLDIASKVFFNKDWAEYEHQVSEIVAYINKSCGPSMFTVLKAVPATSKINQLKNIIEYRFINNSTSKANSNTEKTILDYLQNYKFNPKFKYKNNTELLDEVVTLLLTGHETSAGAAIFAMALLHISPKFKDLVISEVDSINKDTLDYYDIESCIYLKMLVKETLRMYPPVWFTLRYTAQQDEINGYYLPGNSYLYTNLYALHRHPEYWVDPDGFNPFRFAPENIAKIHQYTYLPFIMGPRTCMAANFSMIEIALIVFKLIRHFEFEKIPELKLKVTPHITLRTDKNFKLYAKIRD